MTADLLALADRLESATGPSWKLDGEIADIVYVKTGRRWMVSPGSWIFFPPAFTVSVDAALRIVPPDCVWTLMTDYGGLNRAMVCRVYNGLIKEQSDGASPALALAAACIRMRHALGERP